MILSYIELTNAKPTEDSHPQRLVDYYGQVKDDFTGADLPAFIVLMKADSTVIDTTRAELASEYSDAGFYFSRKPVEKGIYIVKASLEGYDDVYVKKNISFIGRNVAFKFPIVKMHRRMDSYIHELGEVKVSGTLVKFVHKGDTIVYNAQAFKVPDGSMLDGLVRQLPGAELMANGDIVVNGRKIDNLTLNGDDFFKGNNSVMLDNLPYYTVSQIKVFNKQSERSMKAGRDIDKREYTMDIVLKKEFNRGYLANLQTGGGSHNRYSVQAFVLGYDDLTRISAYTSINNLNQNPRPGDQGNWTPQDMGDGVGSTKKIGLDLSTKDREEKVKNNLTTELSWDRNIVDSHIYSQQFAEGGDIFSNKNSHASARNMKWSLDNKMEICSKLTWNFKTSYQNHDNDEMAKDSTYTLADRLNLESASLWSRKHSYSVTSNINFEHTLPWGDLLMLEIRGGYNTEKLRDNTARGVEYYRSAIGKHQTLTGSNPRSNYNYGGNIGYQISFAQNWVAVPSIAYDQTYHDIDSEYTEDGRLHPSSYSSSKLSRNTKTALEIIHTNYGMDKMLVFDTQLALSRKQESFCVHSLDGSSTHINRNWLPSVSSTFAYQNSKNTFTATYKLTTTTPQMSLMYGPDNTLEPRVTIYRSQALKNTVSNNFQADYKHTFPWHRFSLSSALSWTATHGKISYQKNMNPVNGHFDYKPGNVNGNWNYSLSLSANMNIDKAGLFNLSSRTTHQYVHDVDFDISTNGLTDRLSKVNNNMIEQSLKLTFKKKELQIGLKGVLKANHATSNRVGFESFTYYNFNYGVNMQVPLLWKVGFTTDFSIYSRRGYTVESMNSNDIVWNASLSRSLMKKKLTLSLESYDLLHQLSKNRLTVNSQARTEVRCNTIPSYYMLRLQYHFSLLP